MEQGWVKSLAPVHVDQTQRRGGSGDEFASDVGCRNIKKNIGRPRH